MKNVDNIIAVLEHSDRVFEIGLYDVSFLGLSILLEAMEEPFPELLELSAEHHKGRTNIARTSRFVPG